MTDPRYHNPKIKSLVGNDKNEMGKDQRWGIVFYDSTKTNAMEKEIKELLKRYKTK
jgi:hypothetical protein